MLKFWIKKDRLSFTWDWVTPQREMIADKDGEDLIARLFSNLHVGSLDDVLGAITRMEGDEVPDAVDIF